MTTLLGFAALNPTYATPSNFPVANKKAQPVSWLGFYI